MYEVCEDAVADGVKYLEVRFSPILHTKQGMSLSQVTLISFIHCSYSFLKVMEAICEGQGTTLQLECCIQLFKLWPK
jgi:adenosine deaminase